MVVTVSGSKKAAPPVLNKEDIVARQAKDPRPVLDWQPATGEHGGLDFAIVIDEGADTSIGNQLDDLRAFIHGLPANSRVAVAYAANGTVQYTQEFTTDHESAAKALRLPMGAHGTSSTIYYSLADMIERWPAGAARREVVAISDGIDLLRGIDSTEPTSNNIDLQNAIETSQKAGVVVYTLFTSGTGRIHSNLFLINNGQGCLARLALETGGEFYYQGYQTPLAFAPYLDDIKGSLSRQYLLTFAAKPLNKPGFAQVRVTTEVHGADIAAPAEVYVPATK